MHHYNRQSSLILILIFTCTCIYFYLCIDYVDIYTTAIYVCLNAILFESSFKYLIFHLRCKKQIVTIYDICTVRISKPPI